MPRSGTAVGGVIRLPTVMVHDPMRQMRRVRLLDGIGDGPWSLLIFRHMAYQPETRCSSFLLLTRGSGGKPRHPLAAL
jgi:hypothetical protein